MVVHGWLGEHQDYCEQKVSYFAGEDEDFEAIVTIEHPGELTQGSHAPTCVPAPSAVFHTRTTHRRESKI